MKEFNTTAVCIPSKHYMVDITDRVNEIKKLVDAGKYFTINRARQYGKTTTLNELRKILEDTYTVISLDFQGIGADGFKDEASFVIAFCRLLVRGERAGVTIPGEILEKLNEFILRKINKARLTELFDVLIEWFGISDRPMVLMIDEVDSASNNQVFLDFLAQLRNGYIGRDTGGSPAFQSVILAGVTDIKHLRSKIRDKDQHKVNSPWNIASDFDIDMSLSVTGIAGMLGEYENDHHTGMDINRIAKLIRDYTGGYPFLVSRICQLIDKDVNRKMGSLAEAWTDSGMDEAVKLILAEDNSLFQSLTGKLENYPELRSSIRRILMDGTRLSYNIQQESIAAMQMYGFIKNENNAVVISNRIFETLLYNYFLSAEEMKSDAFYIEGDQNKNIFVENGKLNMQLIMEHFIDTFHQIYGEPEDGFLEKGGRELFLLYLRPIINGTGNYYIEAKTRDRKRTDVIVDYLGKQYIIELKIWRGERYNSDGEKQISDYLDYFNLSTGYMLSFNFSKKKESGVKRIQVGDKVLFEGMV